MNFSARAILAIIKKDIISMLPLLLLALVVFFIQPVIANLNVEELGIDSEFMVAMQANFYWVAFFLSLTIMIVVLQHDPAASLHHDWLTRPISRLNWLLAKLLFLCLTIVLPVITARYVINLSEGLEHSVALGYALGIASFEAAILVPLFFMIALLTPNIKKSIFTLFLVFIVFLLPGWSVTRPLLNLLGIELGSELNGMMWVQTMPVVAAGIAGTLGIYYFLYIRRQSRWAYGSFWAAVAVMFFSVYPPTTIYHWDRAIALHQAMINDDDSSLEAAIELVKTQACYPATFNDNPANSQQGDELLAQAAWIPAALNMMGSDAMTLATPVRTRDTLVEWFAVEEGTQEISVDWRVDRFRARAWYQADSIAEPVELLRSTTAANRFAPISNTGVDYWMLPGEAAARLAADPSTKLTIEYDMALLSPTAHELPVDGVRRNFPELGNCKAQRDSNSNQIDVDCIKRGERPELLSAQLIGLDGSRVDSWNQTNFTANWIEALGRSRFELTIDKATLVDSSSIMLTSYNVERVMRKQLVSPGLLGDSPAVCPLPSQDLQSQLVQSNWSDKSPHEVSSVAVQQGVRLEVLDWRSAASDANAAPTLLLLPGLGATAHSFDALAQRLSGIYNVVAMTRRGTGASSHPDHGYDVERLSADVLQVIASMNLGRPVLAGHSIAGEELSYIGAHHPDAISGLIYLDAAFDRTGGADREQRALSRQLPEPPPIRPAETVSYAAYADYMARLGRQPLLPEGELLASYDLATGAVKLDLLYLDAIIQGLRAPEYTRISVPALALYAVPGSAYSKMENWYDASDPQVRDTVQKLFEIESQRKLAEAARFDKEVMNSEVIILEDANHWIFGSHEDAVITAMKAFIDTL